VVEGGGRGPTSAGLEARLTRIVHPSAGAPSWCVWSSAGRGQTAHSRLPTGALWIRCDQPDEAARAWAAWRQRWWNGSPGRQRGDGGAVGSLRKLTMSLWSGGSASPWCWLISGHFWNDAGGFSRRWSRGFTGHRGRQCGVLVAAPAALTSAPDGSTSSTTRPAPDPANRLPRRPDMTGA
jgi:hypothetical protein